MKTRINLHLSDKEYQKNQYRITISVSSIDVSYAESLADAVYMRINA